MSIDFHKQVLKIWSYLLQVNYPHYWKMEKQVITIAKGVKKLWKEFIECTYPTNDGQIYKFKKFERKEPDNKHPSKYEEKVIIFYLLILSLPEEALWQKVSSPKPPLCHCDTSYKT